LKKKELHRIGVNKAARSAGFSVSLTWQSTSPIFPFVFRQPPFFFLPHSSHILLSTCIFLSLAAKMHFSQRTILLAGLLQSVQVIAMDDLAVEFNTAVASGGTGLLAESKLLFKLGKERRL